MKLNPNLHSSWSHTSNVSRNLLEVPKKIDPQSGRKEVWISAFPDPARRFVIKNFPGSWFWGRNITYCTGVLRGVYPLYLTDGWISRSVHVRWPVILVLFVDCVYCFTAEFLLLYFVYLKVWV